MVLTGENRRARRKHLPVPLCVSQIPIGQARGATRISTARGGPLTARSKVENQSKLLLQIQSVPRSKHVSVIKTRQSMYREIIAVCSDIHIKHINMLCGQNVGFVSVEPGGK